MQWLGGAPIFRVVFWWLAFLVLTVAGERLELNRTLRPTRAVRWAFVLAMVTVSVRLFRQLSVLLGSVPRLTDLNLRITVGRLGKQHLPTSLPAGRS